MTDEQQVEVFLTASGIGSKITIDGVEIKEVTKIVITAQAKKATTIEVTRLVGNGVKIRGNVGLLVEKPISSETQPMSDEFAR